MLWYRTRARSLIVRAPGANYLDREVEEKGSTIKLRGKIQAEIDAGRTEQTEERVRIRAALLKTAGSAALVSR